MKVIFFSLKSGCCRCINVSQTQVFVLEMVAYQDLNHFLFVGICIPQKKILDFSGIKAFANKGGKNTYDQKLEFAVGRVVIF